MKKSLRQGSFIHTSNPHKTSDVQTPNVNVENTKDSKHANSGDVGVVGGLMLSADNTMVINHVGGAGWWCWCYGVGWLCWWWWWW